LPVTGVLLVIMYIYQGKLDHYYADMWYAKNETITLVVPRGFYKDEDVCAYWQWSIDGNGVPKSHNCIQGRIDGLVETEQGYEIKMFSEHFYTFVGTVFADGKTMKLTMQHLQKNEKSSPILMEQCYHPSDDEKKHCYVYTGTLNFFDYAVNELITVVVPHTFHSQKDLRAHWQFSNPRKTNAVWDGEIVEVERDDTRNRLKIQCIENKLIAKSGEVNGNISFKMSCELVSDHKVMFLTITELGVEGSREATVALTMRYKKPSRPARGFFLRETSEVINDLREGSYECTLDQWSDQNPITQPFNDPKGLILSTAGLLLTAAGIAVSLVAPPIGIAATAATAATVINTISVLFAAGTILDAATPALGINDDSKKWLFKGETIRRTSNAYDFKNYNRLTVTRYFIDHDYFVTERGVSREQLETTMYGLSELIKDIKFETIHRLQLQPGPSPYVLRTVTHVTLHGTQPSVAGKVVDRPRSHMVVTEKDGLYMTHGKVSEITELIPSDGDSLYLQDDIDTRDEYLKPGLFYVGNHVYFLTLRASVIPNGVIPDGERPYVEKINQHYLDVPRILRSLKHQFAVMQCDLHTITCYKNIKNTGKIVLDAKRYEPQYFSIEYDHISDKSSGILPITYLRVSELSTSHTFD